MKNKITLIILCGALFASACSTPEERAETAAQEEEQRRERYQEFISALENVCSQYGYRRGTESFAKCVQTERWAVEARAREKQAQKDKAFRDFQCLGGNSAFCENGPRTTNCSKDVHGNVQCVTR